MVKITEISFLPEDAGCYLFKDKEGKIIYVGKAKNLKKRVSSYFQKKELDPKTSLLVSSTTDIDIFITGTEIEAFLLENNLIKKYYPKFNLDLKDSRRYAYLLLHDWDLPWIEVVRQREEKGNYYGPFVSGAIRNLVFDIITRNFKILTRKPSLKLRKTIDLHNYTERISQVKKILSGNVDDLILELTEKMKTSSLKTHYEYALSLRNQILALKTLKEKQVMEMHRLVDAHVLNYKIINDKVFLLLFFIRKGVLEEKQAFSFVYYEDFLNEFLVQYYDTALIPNELILPCEIDNILKEYLSKKSSHKISFLVPLKGDKKELLDLVNNNINSTFFAGSEGVLALQHLLGMQRLPKTIECFDISHLSGTNTVASMVSFKNGLPDKTHYRKFKINAETSGDDYLAMAEVIQRRYYGSLSKRLDFPDLIVVDGGLGQLHAAANVLTKKYKNLTLISLAKRFEEIYVHGKTEPLIVERKNKGLQLLQAIRDEAHRFAITYQRLLRNKHSLGET